MRCKILLGLAAMLLAAACAADATEPSASRMPAVQLRLDGAGNGQFGSGGFTDTASTPPTR